MEDADTDCVCRWAFYFNVATAWTHPDRGEMDRWEKSPRVALTPYLKNLLWQERQPEPQAPVNKWHPLLRRYYSKIETENYYEVDAYRRPRYAKIWEGYFRKGAETPSDFDDEDFSELPGKIGARIAVDHGMAERPQWCYSIVKYRPAPLWERPSHKDKVEDVEKFLRCSRATAFRHMADGFRIPRKFRPTLARDLTKRASMQAGRPYCNVVHIPRGSTQSEPGEITPTSPWMTVREGAGAAGMRG
jgi:hypothetical protein